MNSTVSAPVVVWLMAIIGLFIWMAFRPYATAPWKVLALIVFFAAEPLSNGVMNAEKHAFPLKYDYFLQALDQTLGLTAFMVARHLAEWHKAVLFAIYQSLSLAMIAWYTLHLILKNGNPRQLLYSYLLTYFLGPSLYLIVPACGPRHAFGVAFPWGQPSVGLMLTPLNYWPNAMPSLHVATALLLLFFSARNAVLRAVAWVYLAGTILGTLAFEHYVIDLVVAVPYACFAFTAARSRFKAAMAYLGLVLAWLLLIRTETPVMIAHPLVLRVAALATICAVPAVARRFWHDGRPRKETPLATLAGSQAVDCGGA
jgi:hypothetical protein